LEKQTAGIKNDDETRDGGHTEREMQSLMRVTGLETVPVFYEDSDIGKAEGWGMTETPKDFIDRTMRNRTTAVGEEGGGFGPGHKSITYVIVEVNDPKRFAEIAKNYPKNTRKRDNKTNELSWWGSTDKIREKVIIDISKHDVKIFISNDENRPDKTDSEKRYLKVLKKAAGAMIENTEANHIDFILDENPFVPSEVIDRSLLNMAAAKNKTATITHVHSFNEPLVQVTDFIAGSANSQDFYDRLIGKVVQKK